MTNKIHRTAITIETHARTIIRQGGDRPSVHCERCGCMVEAFTPGQTATHFGMTVNDICKAIEANRFHLVGATRGLPLVCGNSDWR